MSENNLLKCHLHHIRDKVTTGNIMLYVVIALLPHFGVWSMELWIPCIDHVDHNNSNSRFDGVHI